MNRSIQDDRPVGGASFILDRHRNDHHIFSIIGVKKRSCQDFAAKYRVHILQQIADRSRRTHAALRTGSGSRARSLSRSRPIPQTPPRRRHDNHAPGAIYRPDPRVQKTIDSIHQLHQFGRGQFAGHEIIQDHRHLIAFANELLLLGCEKVLPDQRRCAHGETGKDQGHYEHETDKQFGLQ